MAPLTPTWAQPSHPHIQQVIYGTNSRAEFTSKSVSRVTLPPFATYAKFNFPPCSYAERATYATVQVADGLHMNLNSDLVYVNHSCDPSVIFDTTSRSIIAGPHGLQIDEELTFFYPSTEWSMAQGFQCLCLSPKCKGYISGAKDMSAQSLEGIWLNVHIRELIEERDGLKEGSEDAVAKTLSESVEKAEEALEAARRALDTYLRSEERFVRAVGGRGGVGTGIEKGDREVDVNVNGDSRDQRDITSGEMGRDTFVS